jgi:DNA repair protein RadC
MKHLAPHDRPREKLERLGPAALGDNELLAVILGSGSRDAGALALANTVLARADGLVGLTRGTRGAGARSDRAWPPHADARQRRAAALFVAA